MTADKVIKQTRIEIDKGKHRFASTSVRWHGEGQRFRCAVVAIRSGSGVSVSDLGGKTLRHVLSNFVGLRLCSFAKESSGAG